MPRLCQSFALRQRGRDGEALGERVWTDLASDREMSPPAVRLRSPRFRHFPSARSCKANADVDLPAAGTKLMMVEGNLPSGRLRGAAGRGWLRGMTFGAALCAFVAIAGDWTS